MDDQNPTATKRPSGRPAVLVCSIALAAAAGASASLVPDGWRAPVPSASLQSAAALFGRSASGPTSFADVVEAVKPAVKTKRSENFDEQSGSPMDRFLREFGAPPLTPETPGGRHPPRLVTTQGSGFSISADGYAVTNDHVIEGSKTAEIQTDGNAARRRLGIGR